MINNSLIDILKEFDVQRMQSIKDAPTPNDREKYAEFIAGCFMSCAQKILAGYFEVNFITDGNKTIRKIHPTAIELYYHEEGPGRFKDPIMYHTYDRKKADHEDYFDKRGISVLPFFPIGSINPHTSGLDITFENPKEQYRASCLIREYIVEYESGKKLSVKNSTDIYDDMLINGIPIEQADWIEWHNGETLKENDVIRKWRRNVPDYKQINDNPYRWEKNTDGEPSFATTSGRYKKCPFNWQFAI